MKKIVVVFLLALTACVYAPISQPQGMKPCVSDADCDHHEYCGFVAVDTYAVCKHKPFEYNSHEQ